MTQALRIGEHFSRMMGGDHYSLTVGAVLLVPLRLQ